MADSFVTKLYKETKRILPLLLVIAITAIVFGDWSQIVVQLYKLSMVALVVCAFHIARQFLFPYIDLKLVYVIARKESLGAAIVFLSIIAFLIAVIVISVV
jgi:hypothetical protein